MGSMEQNLYPGAAMTGVGTGDIFDKYSRWRIKYRLHPPPNVLADKRSGNFCTVPGTSMGISGDLRQMYSKTTLSVLFAEYIQKIIS